MGERQFVQVAQVLLGVRRREAVGRLEPVDLPPSWSMLISRGGKGVASSRSASSSANCSGDLMLRLYFSMATS